MEFEEKEALFLNGVYEDVLKEIYNIQSELPDFILFLQPYKTQAIKKLAANLPTSENPFPLYISTTDDLATVKYAAEIVGWDDKRELSEKRHHVISRLLWTLQPNEGGLYNLSTIEGEESVNLLHIRRLAPVAEPFSVTKLIKTSDGKPYSANRTTSGGWSYVKLIC